MRKPYRIETMEKCNKFLEECRQRGYTVWQMQYRWDEPEGFHAWFYKSGHEDIEVITHNKQIQQAIVKFEP